MSLTIFSLSCLILMGFSTQLTTSTASNNIDILQSDVVEVLLNRFPIIIDKIKDTVSRFRCPKGWKRLGGSCYYFSNLTSIASNANYTCNQLYSNQSHLIQIQSPIELFYAAHILSKNHLSSLLIDIDPTLLEGKKISEMLKNNGDQWERSKKELYKVRVKYQNLTKNIHDQLNSAGLRIFRRSRKRPDLAEKYKLNDTIINNNVIVNNDEYEYDDLDSSDETDEFEQIQDIRGICDDIHWNVLNNSNNTTVFILTKYYASDKIVCSLSDVEPHTKYPYICEYVLDFCFANILCGKHGRCVNTLSGFKCSCSFLYGGRLCKKMTQQGREILIGIFITGILLVIVICCKIKHHCEQKQKKKDLKEKNSKENNDLPLPSTPLLKYLRTSSCPKNFGSIRIILVGIFTGIILSIIYSVILLRYMKLYNIEASGTIHPNNSNNIVRNLVTNCAQISNYNRKENMIFAFFACALIVYFGFLIKIKTRCAQICDGRPGLLSPIRPFCIRHRLITAAVFGVLAFEVLKIFEILLFSFSDTLKRGILTDLLMRILTIFYLGLQYYPVLASIHLHNISARFLICLYITGNIIYTIIREGSCMGYLPLSGQYTAIEEAKLRIELGTWFIVYGLIKNTPHFCFLSLIAAELCVRFVYDSIYIPLKEGRSLWLPSSDQMYISGVCKPCLKKRLQSKRPLSQTVNQKNTTVNNTVNNNQKCEQPNKMNQTCFRKLVSYIYDWDDNFYFTTMVVCTYTVAILFLYYLACTFVFLYISRTTGHVAFLKSYIESSTNTELEEIPFKMEVIISAILTVVIYGIQLLCGMQQYKKDKKQLREQLSSIKSCDRNVKVIKSVRYPGFLVGYMAWGFIICFHFIFLILIAIRILYLRVYYFEITLAVILPIVVVYLLKHVSVETLGEVLFVRKQDEKADTNPPENSGWYAILIYFMFFADCFLGIASSVIRLVEATLANLMCMARLDYCFFGRPFKEYDPGYVAYQSYLRMELDDPHRIPIVFCCLCWSSIYKRSKIHREEEHYKTVHYDDERKKTRQINTTDELVPNVNQNIRITPMKRISKTSLHKQNYDSLFLRSDENNPVRIQYNRTDEKINLTSTHVLPTNRSQNSSLTTDNRKFKQRTSGTSTTQVNVDDNDGFTNSRILSGRQRRISKPSPNVTRAIIHQEPSSEQDQSADDKTKPCYTHAETIQQQQSNLISSRRASEIYIDDLLDEIEDDGSDDETKGTDRMMASTRQSLSDNLNAKDKPSSNDRMSISVGTDVRKASEISGDSRNTKLKKTTDRYRYKSVPTEEEHIITTTTTDSSPLNSQNLVKDKVNYLRSISYATAQQRSAVPISPGQISSTSLCGQFSIHDDDSTISDVPVSPCINNSVDSSTGLIQFLSGHSGEQQTITEENEMEAENKKEELKRKKIVRTRWYLAYTLVCNPSLSALRKKIPQQEEYRRLHSQQSAQLSEEIAIATTLSTEAQHPALSNVNVDSQSAPEQPILTHSQMPEVVDTQQITTGHSISMEHIPMTNVSSQEETNSSTVCKQDESSPTSANMTHK